MGHVWVKAADVDRLLRADRIHEIEVENGMVRVTLGTMSYKLFPTAGQRRPSSRAAEDLVRAIADAESNGKPYVIAARPAPEGDGPDADATEVDVVWERTDLHQQHMKRISADAPADAPIADLAAYRPAEGAALFAGAED